MGNSRINASLVTTVYNESSSIEEFLNSIKLQTKKPTEMLIVDAGSKDGTQEIIKKFIKENKNLKIKLFIKKGNRSIGRNEGIKKAKNEIIAITDAGCILKKNWLEEITKPFVNKKIEVVAGFYHPLVENIFQKSLASYTCVMKDELNKDFLPSSRSISFKKTAWEKIGGYPENLDTCEDLVFASKLKREGFKFFINSKAIVIWPQKNNLVEAFTQFFSYAIGDGKAHYFRRGTPFLFLRALIFIILIIISFKNVSFFYILISLVILYLIWSILKNYKYVKNYLALIYLPVLQVTSDIAVFSGTIVGFLTSFKDN